MSASEKSSKPLTLGGLIILIAGMCLTLICTILFFVWVGGLSDKAYAESVHGLEQYSSGDLITHSLPDVEEPYVLVVGKNDDGSLVVVTPQVRRLYMHEGVRLVASPDNPEYAAQLEEFLMLESK